MNTDRHRWVWGLFMLLSSSFLSTHALADGKVFGGQADPDPGMPFQRGLIAFDNGIETLIVEPAIDGAPGEYSWVVPIPSKALSVEAVGPGALETAVRTLSPIVSRSPSEFTAIYTLLWLTVLFFTLRAAYRRSSPGAYIVEVLLALLGVALATIFFPVYAQSKSSALTGETWALGTIGSYKVAEVHSSPDAESTLFELRRRGAVIPPRAEETIRQYQSEGWSFVVARLNKNGRGLAAPHPLKIKFAVARPIYPMRLTGIRPDSLRLQLIVVGPKRASIGSLRTMRSTKARFRSPWKDAGWETPDYRITPYGHPAIASSIARQSMFTYLSGDMSPAQMGKDLVVSWLDNEEQSATLYTAEGRNYHLICWGLFVSSVLMFSLSVFGLNASKSTDWFLRVGIGGSLAATFLATLVYGSKIEVVRAKFERGTMVHSRVKMLTIAVELTDWQRGESLSEALDRSLKDSFERLSMQIPPEKDIPGGYIVQREGDEWVVTIYDETGSPRSRRFSPP